ncbi:hypothetical protein [Psychromonas sp.]|uniref:hypothetical protein n=1 Tax=Psychromonas sp. TaxID=1884585 RepID=UPI0035644134
MHLYYQPHLAWGFFLPVVSPTPRGNVVAAELLYHMLSLLAFALTFIVGVFALTASHFFSTARKSNQKVPPLSHFLNLPISHHFLTHRLGMYIPIHAKPTKSSMILLLKRYLPARKMEGD